MNKRARIKYRQRCDVPFAMLRDGTLYQSRITEPALTRRTRIGIVSSGPCVHEKARI